MNISVWDAEVEQVIRRGPEARARGIETAFASPADWRDQWIYQIMVDRFNNPSAPPRFAWDSVQSRFQGGTFEGIRDKLDYLQELGVGALWLTPVLKNRQSNEFTHHGYGIQDFLAVEPRFASDPAQAERELRALVNAAHDRGMYVIFDIVLNHAGDVFAYNTPEGLQPRADWRDHPYTIFWRDAAGTPLPEWTEAPDNPPPDAAVWPSELRHNAFFRRQGSGSEAGGDFDTLKELATEPVGQDERHLRPEHLALRDALIRIHQYLIAQYDIDGFRIDTLKYIAPNFARTFGAAIREYAQSIGKLNFFTFGEVADNEEKIAHFIGRNSCADDDELVGVDAALDFPLFNTLPQVAKGMLPPSEVIDVFSIRRRIQRGILSSHGEASRFFVTFLDNHDQHRRLRYTDPADPHKFDDQVTLALGCLFCLQGIPCLYYGTEQGLHGTGNVYEAVREALWGMPNAFDIGHPIYQAISRLSRLRRAQPALRYGRQYFRPLSGDGFHFGVSTRAPGVLAFSRILQAQEIVVVANTQTEGTFRGEILVDHALSQTDPLFHPLFTNRGNLVDLSANVSLEKAHTAIGPIRTLPVTLAPMEIQVWGKEMRA